MRVLTLDDMDSRHQMFRRWFAGYDLVETVTAPSAISALEHGAQFDLVMLDHDLAEQHYLIVTEGLSERWEEGLDPYAPGTGMDVVDYIVKMPPERRPKAVVVHSWNTTRAGEMVSRLIDAGVNAVRKPFRRDEPVVFRY